MSTWMVIGLAVAGVATAWVLISNAYDRYLTHLPSDPAKGEWRVWHEVVKHKYYQDHDEETWHWEVSFEGRYERGRRKGALSNEGDRFGAIADAAAALRKLRKVAAAEKRLAGVRTNITEPCPVCTERRRAPGRLTCDNQECTSEMHLIRAKIGEAS